MPNRPVRLLLADSHQLFRQGLAALFEHDPRFEVMSQTNSGESTINAVYQLSPNVLLANIDLHGLESDEVTRRVRMHASKTEVVLYSRKPTEAEMRLAFGSGARGFISQECDFTQIAQAVLLAARGEYFLSEPVSYDQVAEFVKPILKSQRPGGVITQREREIARLLADGYSTKEAAEVLNISPKTAETHRASLMKKLNAKNVTDIVKYCIRNGIIQL